jgi:DNA-binding CsgD family transcriptional regulator
MRTGGWFQHRHAESVCAISRPAADGIRLALLRAAAARPDLVDEPPGIVLARPDGNISPLTGPAEQWLAVGGPDLVTAINVAAAAIRRRPTSQNATSRLVLADGRVLALRAAGTTDSVGEADGAAPVIVDRAIPAEVSAMIVDAYGLTRRQRQVLGHLLLGTPMTRLAHALGISEHTAQDHRKAIYQRMSVSSRSELSARLQFEQYYPRVWSDVAPSPYGGFLEAPPASGVSLNS